jgi:hypothetical protein
MLQLSFHVCRTFLYLHEDGQVSRNMLQFIISIENKFWLRFDGLFCYSLCIIRAGCLGKRYLKTTLQHGGANCMKKLKIGPLLYVLKYCHKWVQNYEGVIDDFSWKSSIVWLATVAIVWVTMYVHHGQPQIYTYILLHQLRLSLYFRTHVGSFTEFLLLSFS